MIKLIKKHFYWFLSLVCLLSGFDELLKVPQQGFALSILPYLAGGFLFLPPVMERNHIPLLVRWLLFFALVGATGAVSYRLNLPFVLSSPTAGGL